MTKQKIRLVDWAALAPGVESREQWQQWAGGSRQIQAAFEKSPSPSLVPAMLRRRLGPLGKLALSCAYQMADNFVERQASVFASQHGEVQRTVSMLNDLAQQQALSPTAFSLSVHNSIAGIHSIALKDVQPITAISAGPDSLAAAVLEAAGLLAEGHLEQVLCVIYDEPLPELYGAEERAPSSPLAIALLLARADSSEQGQILEFELHPRPEAGSDTAHSDLNLGFVRFLLAKQQAQYQLCAQQRCWSWAKLGG